MAIPPGRRRSLVPGHLGGRNHQPRKFLRFTIRPKRGGSCYIVLCMRMPGVPWKGYRNASAVLDHTHPEGIPVLERLGAKHRGVAAMLEPTCKGSVGTAGCDRPAPNPSD